MIYMMWGAFTHRWRRCCVVGRWIKHDVWCIIFMRNYSPALRARMWMTKRAVLEDLGELALIIKLRFSSSKDDISWKVLVLNWLVQSTSPNHYVDWITKWKQLFNWSWKITDHGRKLCESQDAYNPAMSRLVAKVCAKWWPPSMLPLR